MISYRTLNPLYEKIEVYWRLRNLLDGWKIPSIGRISQLVHLVTEVHRFHIYAYWRPMTRSRFEETTLHYLGPHIPLFMSDREFADEEEMVWQGRRYTKYNYVRCSPYFYAPAFVFFNEWPHEREWTWTPVVRTTPKLIREALMKEIIYGGWTKNKRGRARIPFKTGTSTLLRTVEPGQGWASYRPASESRVLVDGQQQDDFDLHADLSIQGRAGFVEDDQRQGAFTFSIDGVEREAV